MLAVMIYIATTCSFVSGVVNIWLWSRSLQRVPSGAIRGRCGMEVHKNAMKKHFGGQRNKKNEANSAAEVTGEAFPCWRESQFSTAEQWSSNRVGKEEKRDDLRVMLDSQKLETAVQSDLLRLAVRGDSQKSLSH